MPTYDTTLASGYILRLTTTQGTQSVPNNTTVVSWSLELIQVGGSGKYSYYTHSWSVNIGGQTAGGSIGSYDFRSYDVLLLGSGSFTIGHNADGTQSISVSGSFSESVANVGSGTASGTMGLTTIPRASTPTTSPNPCDAGATMTINTNRASTSFTHTVKYTFGAATGTIATNVGASTTWVPPLSLLNQIPNAASGTGTITLETYSGATLIGTKSVGFTLNAPATVVPDFTTVTVSENVALVASQVGAYVQSLSKLNLAITGAAGIYGSTITAYEISVAGQVISAASGVTPSVINASGTVVVTGTVTDSRGRTKTKTVNITVLAYTTPAIDPALTLVRRSNSSGTLDENGTYLRVDMKATVQSLLVAAVQKNALTYRISTRLRGATLWTVKTTITPGGISINSFTTVTSYSISQSHEVLVEILDKFNTAAMQFTIATSAIFQHWGDGLGLGKYYEAGRGSLDAADAAYIENGLRVATRTYVDAADTALRSRTGTVVDISSTGYVVSTAGGNITAKTGDRYWRPHVNDAVVVARDGDGNWVMSPATTRGYIEADIALSNGWEAYQIPSISWSGIGPWSQPKVFKTASGAVVLSGLLKKSTAPANGEIVGTLPVGFRPEYNDIYSAYTNGVTNAALHIDTAGVIRVYGGNGGYLSLDNAKFLTGATWTTPTLLNSFTAYTTPLVAGQTLVTPGHALDMDGVLWLRGNVSRVGVPADNTPIFDVGVGRGPRVGYQHHHPSNAAVASGFATIGFGSQPSTNRQVMYKTAGSPGVSRIGLGGLAFVTESFTGLDYDMGANVYAGIAGFNPRYGITPDNLIVASGIVNGVSVDSVVAYLLPEARPRRRFIWTAASGGGVSRVDVWNTNGAMVAAATNVNWISVEGAFIADQVPYL